MTFAAVSPAERAKSLEQKAMPKARELKGKRLSAKPMSAVLGVSWNTLKKWIGEVPEFDTSGSFEGGAEGIAYSFNPIATVEFLIQHFKAEAEKRRAQTQVVREAIGAEGLGADTSDMTLDEIHKAIRVRAAMIDQQKREGRLIDADIAIGAIDLMVSRMTEAGLKVAREQDPTGQMDPDTAEKFENAMESIMLSMQSAGEACLNELRGGSLANEPDSAAA